MDSFDYVIVGGGTAGPVIAARLTEDPTISVLLIEAGGENAKEAIGYANGAPQMWAPDTNWGFFTVPQPALADRQVMQPRGKVMGGSASINIGSWSRGTAANYDSWNLPRWTWENVKPWYLAIEDSDRGAGEHRGVGGPMKLETSPEGTYMTTLFRQACIEAGIGATDDLNAADNEGFDVWQCIFKGGRRHNTITNYLDAARLRANLTIQTNAHVTRVLFDGTTATGIEYVADDSSTSVGANHEVIVCAGAYASPQLLMLSGVGPADHLRQHGIDVLVDLPGVGSNLSDHLRTDVGVMAPEGVGVSLRADAASPAELEEWRTTGYGPLAVAENTSVAFLRSSDSVPVADAELMFNINAPAEMGSPPPAGHGYHIDVGLVQPKSKGTIRLASADPTELALVDPNYFTHPDDVVAYTRSIRLALGVMQTQTLAPFTDANTLSLSPSATDAEIQEYIAQRAQSIYHPVGTCRMGRDGDSDAVVNQQGQVNGVERLRVADSSVVPDLVSGHTMAPTILVAERTAAAIKSERA